MGRWEGFHFRHINRRVYPQKHILVCEDDIGNQAAIAAHLCEMFGGDCDVQCTFVPGGLAAALLLEPQANGYDPKFDLILLDHDMPQGNAIDLLAWMKDRGLRIPVITFSGIPYNNDAMMAAGADHRFDKGSVIAGAADDLIRSLLEVRE